MLIDPGRGTTGTIGGGCGEAEVVDAARLAVEEGRARVVRVDLTDDLYSFSPAICGGVFDVLLEPVIP
jgi:xanthine dehydrogenase accessory factor